MAHARSEFLVLLVPSWLNELSVVDNISNEVGVVNCFLSVRQHQRLRHSSR
jgi:hypothetical protein